MPNFKIAQDPTFKAEVDIPRVNGETIKVPFVFKYRDRKELAALFTEWQTRLKADKDAIEAKGDEVTLIDVTDADIARQVVQIAELVHSWGFDDPLSDESIRALVATSSGAAHAIVDAYQKAFIPARQGN